MRSAALRWPFVRVPVDTDFLDVSLLGASDCSQLAVDRVDRRMNARRDLPHVDVHGGSGT
jgi:hypothetical protein